MRANEQNAVPRSAQGDCQLTPGRLNEFGDIACPHCGINIITPAEMELVPGVAVCVGCGKSFDGTRIIPDEAEIIHQCRSYFWELTNAYNP